MARQWFLALALLTGFSSSVFGLPTSVLSNFNQPAAGYLTLRSLDLFAVPFVTDSQFTQLDGVEINAVTLSPPGNLLVQIWDIDAFAQPNSVVGTLTGPTDPTGLSAYTGTVNLQPDTSYFLVIRAGNGASSFGTAVYAAIDNQSDSQPPPIYRIGTDFNGNGAIDFVNKCTGTTSASGIFWNCGGLTATRFFPEFRILAEGPPLTNFSLTSTPLSLDFGLVPDGSTSAAQTAVIENDGTAAQDIGSVSVGAGFTLASDSCSNTTLAPGATCSLGLTFTPTQGGVTTGTAIIPAPLDSRSPYGLALTGESDQPGVVLPPFGSINPVAVPLRFTLFTVLGLLVIAALQHQRARIGSRSQRS